MLIYNKKNLRRFTMSSALNDCENNIKLLGKWCSDCVHKGRTILHDPCHGCVEGGFVDGVPRY